ncbi:hypothetical protein B0H13DRAFT_1893983 [Mycena leptocephala]|nr:hypothetical protein B0H13DRAFT_1893983 [Mycena leptocephala]
MTSGSGWEAAVTRTSREIIPKFQTEQNYLEHVDHGQQLWRRASAGEDESLFRLLDGRAHYLCVRTSRSRRKAAAESSDYPKVLDRVGRSNLFSIVIGSIWNISAMSIQLCRRASAGEDESLFRMLDGRAQLDKLSLRSDKWKSAADSSDYPKVLDRVGRSNLFSIVIGSIWNISAMNRQPCRTASVGEDESPFRLIDGRASSPPKLDKLSLRSDKWKSAADSSDYPKVLDRVGRSNLFSIVIGSIWNISAMSRQNVEGHTALYTIVFVARRVRTKVGNPKGSLEDANWCRSELRTWDEERIPRRRVWILNY